MKRFGLFTENYVYEGSVWADELRETQLSWDFVKDSTTIAIIYKTIVPFCTEMVKDES